MAIEHRMHCADRWRVGTLQMVISVTGTMMPVA